MSPRRHATVTTIQAIVGAVLLVAAVGGFVGISHLLQLPQLTTAPLPPPELGGPAQSHPGEVVCPRRGELRDRPVPMPVTSTELIECPLLFDGETVVYQGEAVGAVLLRRDHAWLHLNDDVYASQLGPVSRHRTVSGGNSGMAVSVPREDGVGITTGSKRARGTLVEVVGVFHRSHEKDLGAPGIAADSVRVVEGPERFGQELSTPRLVTAAVLAPVTVVLIGLQLRRRRRTD